MSYASKAKTKLSKLTVDTEIEQKCELSALIKSSGEIHIAGLGRLDVTVTTENAATARRIFEHFKQLYQKHSEIVVKKNRSLKKHNSYQVKCLDVKEILTGLGILSTIDGITVVDDVPGFVSQSESAVRAYLRGLFLGAGAVSDPARAYHFEIVVHSREYAKKIQALFLRFDLAPRIIKRKKNFVIYLKEAQSIVDILSIVGAYDALLMYENARVMKSVRNRTNRMVNCDTANLNKMMSAAQRHLDAIDLIESTRGLSSLPDSLNEIAKLRRDYPELTLAELGQLMTPPLGKSGIHHRMKKLESIASQIREDSNYG